MDRLVNKNWIIIILGQPAYVPAEGCHPSDLEKAWNELEQAEHGREVSLKDELLRQERLQTMAHRFLRKAQVCVDL